MILRTGGSIPPSRVPTVHCATHMFLTIVAHLVLSGEGECFVVREWFQCFWILLFDSIDSQRLRVFVIRFSTLFALSNPPDTTSIVCPFFFSRDEYPISAFGIPA